MGYVGRGCGLSTRTNCHHPVEFGSVWSVWDLLVVWIGLVCVHSVGLVYGVVMTCEWMSYG